MIFQVAGVMLLINAARRFGQTAKLWQEAEEAEESITSSSIRSIQTRHSDQSTNCPSLGGVLIVFSVILAAIIQTTVGTLTTVVINSRVSNFTDPEGTENTEMITFHLIII